MFKGGYASGASGPRTGRGIKVSKTIHHLARVHDAFGVEGGFECPHQVQFHLGFVADEIFALELADAVLGAEAALHVHGQIVDEAVEVPPLAEEGLLVHANGLAQVEMNVAVAQVAEGASADAGEFAFDHRRRPGDEFGDLRHRHRDVVLDGATLVFLGLGDGLPETPQLPCLGSAGGDDCIIQEAVVESGAKDRFQGIAEARAGTGQLDESVIRIFGPQGVDDAGNVFGREIVT